VESLYSNILQCLPTNYERTLEELLRCFNDEQICQILSTDNHNTANKTILDFLIDHYKEKRNLSELCDRLEKIMNILPEPGELVVILCDLRAGELILKRILYQRRLNLYICYSGQSAPTSCC